MIFKNENACLQEVRTLAEYINSSEFEYDDSDKNNILFENDEYSIITDNTSKILLTSIITINSNL